MGIFWPLARGVGWVNEKNDGLWTEICFLQKEKQLTLCNRIYSLYSNIIQVPYFCVLFGEEVDKRESSMCSRP